MSSLLTSAASSSSGRPGSSSHPIPLSGKRKRDPSTGSTDSRFTDYSDLASLLSAECIETIEEVNRLAIPIVVKKDPTIRARRERIIDLFGRIWDNFNEPKENQASIDYVFDLIKDLKSLKAQIDSLEEREESLESLERDFEIKKQEIIEILDKFKAVVDNIKVADIQNVIDRIILNLARNGNSSLASELGEKFCTAETLGTTVEGTSKQLYDLYQEIIEKEPTFTVLDLSHLTLRTVPLVIGKLSQLTSLIFSGNHLKMLPNSIGELSKLTSLNLSGNRIERLPECIRHLKLLENLDVSCNRIRDLPEWLTELDKLKILEASFNDPLKNLPECLEKLQSTLMKRLFRQRVIDIKY